MQYFKLSQFKNSSNIIQIPNITEDELVDAKVLVKQIKKPQHSYFLNFYEKPFPIVSDQMKKAIKPLYPCAIGQPLGLANMEASFVILYWVLKLELIPAQARNSTIIIDKQHIKDKKIFKTRTGKIDHVILDLDLIESILQMSCVDVEFEEIFINE